VKPSGTGAERSAEPVSPATEPHPPEQRISGRSSSQRTTLPGRYDASSLNRGASGPDGMSTADLRPYLKALGQDSGQDSTLAHTDPARPPGDDPQARRR